MEGAAIVEAWARCRTGVAEPVRQPVNGMEADGPNSYGGDVTGGGRGADVDSVSLDQLLIRAGNAVGRLRARTIAEHGLSATALGVLAVLSGERALSHRELAARLGVTPATLTPVVESLAAGGELVRHRDSGDRRVVRLAVTDAGRVRLDSVSAEVSAAIDAWLPQPTAELRLLLRDYLRAVVEASVGTAPRRNGGPRRNQAQEHG
ncbi:MarR family winged helix-turn-helix transcriptional regulator [Actinomycetes bacterium KLBMP 9759]